MTSSSTNTFPSLSQRNFETFCLRRITLFFYLFFSLVSASGIIVRDVKKITDSLSAEGSAMRNLTYQTDAFTSNNCSVLGALLIQTILVERNINQVVMDISRHYGSISDADCSKVKAEISNMLPAHASGLYQATSKKPDFVACGVTTRLIQSQMVDMRAGTAFIFVGLGPKVSGTCSNDITALGSLLLGYWDSAIADYNEREQMGIWGVFEDIIFGWM
ncbi:unnamed protein product [Tuber melanosporum]|uniref:(Perigord truffle) hypothetical protein n=1 Tax=Tuber melanosporum (strain Mel28) TaxID=656061 RepID=D5G6U7_TUBMM|nr:uncharacterized protein GSTUM_00002278001 [Tuber melanosporum]CAZ80240.1 unnamed protein product [Tuber melanosporum]